MGEEDTIPYELDFKERMRLKLRQQVRRREQFLADADKRMLENRPEFIQQNFKPKQEHVTSLEEKLDAVRLHKNTDERDVMDPLPDRIMPTRRHTMSQVVAQKLTRWVEEPQLDIFSGTKNQHTNGEDSLMSSMTGTSFDGGTTNPVERMPGVGTIKKAPTHNPRDEANQTQQEVLDNLAADAKHAYDGMSERYWPFAAISGEDEMGDNSQEPWPAIPALTSELDGKLDKILGGNLSLEEQLGYGRDLDGTRKTKRPQRPQDLDSTRGWKDRSLRHRMEDMGDNAQPIADWMGLLDNPRYQGGDLHGAGMVPLPRI
jgi:hypothetical protein